MKLITIIFSFAALLASCSSSKKATKTDNQNLNPQTAAVQNATPSSEQDGSSYEKAIYMTEKTETTGVHAEYEWLKKNYPGYTMIKQSLTYKGSKPYDILKIKTKEGDEKEVYFDISNFFGKF